MPVLKLLSGKTVLVTGASGFIGRHLVRRLQQEDGLNLVLLARNPGKEGSSRVDCALEELSAEVWSSAGIEKIDVVFHMAAATPKTSRDGNRIDSFMGANILGLKTLLESLPGVPERFVFASTLDLYAPSETASALDEKSKIEPQSFYAASKLFGEHMLRAFSANCGCESVILRYGHTFGPGEEKYGKLIPQVIASVLREETPVIFGDGSTLRDYFYVEDAVEATVRAAQFEFSGEVEPINVVRGHSVSILEIVNSILRITGATSKIRFVEQARVASSYRFDNGKMKALLGDWPFRSLEYGLKTEIEHVVRRQTEGEC
jgi:UDP-glucose 4-epimerase